MSIKIRLRAELWSDIDGCLDCSAQQAVDDGTSDEPWLEIRKAGWAQVPWVDGGNSWPPMEQVIAITLTPEQWNLALSSIRFWRDVGADIGDAPASLVAEEEALIVQALSWDPTRSQS